MAQESLDHEKKGLRAMFSDQRVARLFAFGSVLGKDSEARSDQEARALAAKWSGNEIIQDVTSHFVGPIDQFDQQVMSAGYMSGYQSRKRR